MAEQLSMRWACRAPTLRDLYAKCVNLLRDIKARGDDDSILIEHIYRDWNEVADALANHALDTRTTGTSSGWA